MMQADTEAGLAQFLASWEKRAYRMAFIATAHQEEALDIVQDAMLKLVRRYSDRSPEEWAPLMQRILQSTIRDWYRRQKVRNYWRWFVHGGHDDEPQGDPMDLQPGARALQPEMRAQYDTAMRMLDDALNNLPLRQQQAFLLRQWEGLDVAETARAMGISQGSVKTHYSRALSALRDRLKDHWE